MTPSLRSLLTDAASSLGDVECTADGAVTTWSRAGRGFAILDGTSVDLHLDPPIAAAAARTPDTIASRRGPDWITFSPRALDGHAVDRVRAWFELAYRRAAA